MTQTACSDWTYFHFHLSPRCAVAGFSSYSTSLLHSLVSLNKIFMFFCFQPNLGSTKYYVKQFLDFTSVIWTLKNVIKVMRDN